MAFFDGSGRWASQLYPEFLCFRFDFLGCYHSVMQHHDHSILQSWRLATVREPARDGLTRIYCAKIHSNGKPHG
jgi:hypothetical protein